jgi:hypothetical protein
MNNEKEGQEKQQHKFYHKPAGLEGLIMACKSASTAEVSFLLYIFEVDQGSSDNWSASCLIVCNIK